MAAARATPRQQAAAPQPGAALPQVPRAAAAPPGRVSPTAREAQARRTSPGRRLSALGLECIRRAAAYNPNNYQVQQELAKMETAMGNAPEARAAQARATQLQPYLNQRPRGAPEKDGPGRAREEAAEPERVGKLGVSGME